CPPSLVDALAREIEARRREELNGLYVAMSRARERLAFSATEPRQAPASASWWERAAPLASPWVVPAAPPDLAGNAGASEATLRLKTLPRWQPPDVAATQATPPAAGANPDGAGAGTEVSRLGEAVHRVLEWGTAGRINAPGVDFDVDVDALARAAALEFGAPFDEVERVARTILHSPQCQRFFGGPTLHWCGNEVPVSDRGEVLRIDRLVRLQDEDGAPTWWVLDYKLQHAPHQLAVYREQLLRYRDVVRRLQPGETVRCAFVTGAGTVVELE
ncbi:MAG TPA: hypothetical protein VFG60_04245, partial [Burkholderiaceae bacterium]|nr:hypothetical protein [Burkholderiaceae bacterium]